ncbi:MAG: imidazole glycerol phosphate synthase subunit HisH [Rhodospirillaceae bacterium]|nr:imidazole glycerol phosphate synthase subunit HisH [Rhodospirillaceae bacterium]
MRRIVVVRFGISNVDSVVRAVEECGHFATLSEDPEAVAAADVVIVPGQGSFGEAMERLARRGLLDALDEAVRRRGVPFLGICLGMQILAATGEEGRSGGSPGLGWVDGRVRRLDGGAERVRIPHVGWNEVVPARVSPLFDGVAEGADFYFVHSYVLEPADPTVALATTPYAGGFVSAVQVDNVTGVQFHPEKSQAMGLRLLANFLKEAGRC